MNATIRPRLVVTNVDDAVTYYEKCLGGHLSNRAKVANNASTNAD